MTPGVTKSWRHEVPRQSKEDTMSKIYNPSGGYRKLHSFNFATIIHPQKCVSGAWSERVS